MPGEPAPTDTPVVRWRRCHQMSRPALAPKLLWALDGAPAPGSPVSDIGELTAAATAAVRAGAGNVLDGSHVVFPNGAVTLVLILAESHLAIHTWPEENLVAVDLFTCGAIDADRVLAELVTGLRLTDTRVQQVRRGVTGLSGRD